MRSPFRTSALTLLSTAFLTAAAPAFATGGGIAGYSGKGGATCNSCHSGTTAAPTVVISGPTALAPGASGAYVVTITGGPGVTAGVDIAPSSGTLTAGDGTTRVSASGEVVHSSPKSFSGGSSKFSFNLVAPAAGPVTLYAAGISCNGNGNEAGDNTTTATLSVSVATASAPTVATPASATPSPVLGTTTGLSVLGADSGGEAGLTYQWAATSGTGVSFSPNGTNAAQHSTATFTHVGNYTLQATVTNAGGMAVTSSVSVMVNAVGKAVTVAPASVTVQTGSTQVFTTLQVDQFNAPLATQPAFTWSVSGGGTVSASGLFTAGSTAGGPFTLTATGGGMSGTAQVSVTAQPPPTIATPASATPSPVTGLTTTLAVLGAGASGEASLTYTWAAANGMGVTFSPNGTNAAKHATATFTAAGSYTFVVTVKNPAGLTATSSVDVRVNEQPSSVAVSPSAVTVQLQTTQQFTATVMDQFGVPLSAQPAVTWSAVGGGTVNGAGLFTAGSTAGGPFSVKATSLGVQGTAQVTISLLAPPTVAQAAAASTTAVRTTTADLQVLGTDPAGEPGLTYSWHSRSGAPVTFSLNDSNAAKRTTATFAAPGQYTLEATIRDPAGLMTSSAVNVTVYAMSTTVQVAPGTATVSVGGELTFAATVLDQFGQTFPVAPSVFWAVDSGGSIDANGNFRSNGAAGSATVTAQTVGAQGSATLIIGTAPGGNQRVATSATASPRGCGVGASGSPWILMGLLLAAVFPGLRRKRPCPS